jgi:hypothetical protein
LTEWEARFVSDLYRERAWRLTEKQHGILDQVIEKIRCYCEAA